MKRFLIATITATALVCPSLAAPNESGIDQTDYVWLVKTLAAMYVEKSCPGRHQFDAAGAALWGDQNGANVKHRKRSFVPI